MKTNSKLHTGLCKIVTINYTKKEFGVNDSMYDLIGHTLKYKISTYKSESMGNSNKICYRINGCLWDKRDLIIISINNDKAKPLPEPKQFNPDFLDI